MKRFVKSTPPSSLLFHHENSTEKYQFSNTNGNIYLCLCALLFQISVSWSSEPHFHVIHLETYGSTQPHVAFWTLEFCSCCFVFSERCTAPSSLPFHRPVFLCLVSSLFSWLMDWACLSCLVVWVWGTLPISYFRSLTNISLNSWCDSFEPQRTRMINIVENSKLQEVEK
jgi:hypothetical protein